MPGLLFWRSLLTRSCGEYEIAVARRSTGADKILHERRYPRSRRRSGKPRRADDLEVASGLRPIEEPLQLDPLQLQQLELEQHLGGVGGMPRRMGDIRPQAAAGAFERGFDIILVV